MTTFSKIQHWFETHRQVAVMAVLAFALFALTPGAFAQTPVPIPTLAIDGNALTSGLFQGANIILIALAGVVFLIVGLSFGGKILTAIQAMIQGLRIG